MWSTVQRWLTITTAVLGVVVLSVAVVTLVADRQTVMTVDDAVADFRADQTEGSSPVDPDGPAGGSPRGPTAPPSFDGPSEADADPAVPAVQEPAHGETPQPAQAATPQEAPSTPGEPSAQEAGSATPPAPQDEPRLTTPEEGVYTYATEGNESVDVLGGSQHEYPERTTITVRHTDCGDTERWEPLRERWEVFDICRGDDRAWMRTITLYHEFFGRGMRHEYTCGVHATLAEASSRAGQRWTWDCQSEGGTMHTELEVVGFQTREVGGSPVEAVRVRIRNAMEGDVRGTRTADVWYDRWSGLELEGIYETDSTVDSPMGPSRYREHFTRTLTDVRPRR